MCCVEISWKDQSINMIVRHLVGAARALLYIVPAYIFSYHANIDVIKIWKVISSRSPCILIVTRYASGFMLVYHSQLCLPLKISLQSCIFINISSLDLYYKTWHALHNSTRFINDALALAQCTC